MFSISFSISSGFSCSKSLFSARFIVLLMLPFLLYMLLRALSFSSVMTKKHFEFLVFSIFFAPFVYVV